MMYSCSSAFNQFPMIMHQSCMHVCKTVGAHESPKGWQLIYGLLHLVRHATSPAIHGPMHALVLYC